jgi:hypothetical protein
MRICSDDLSWTAFVTARTEGDLQTIGTACAASAEPSRKYQLFIPAIIFKLQYTLWRGWSQYIKRGVIEIETATNMTKPT